MPIEHGEIGTVHVDIGAGKSPRNPFRASRLIVCDFIPAKFEHSQAQFPSEFVACDLTRELPFDSNSIDSISAYDVLEHIPRWERLGDGTVTFPFINLMNEIHRCLKPGGLFLAVTPAFPSPAAFQDPTHVNLISEATHIYFVGDEPWAEIIGYGFTGRFEEMYVGWLYGFGPYEMNVSSGQSLGSRATYARIKILRFLKALKRRHPTHLLWVLVAQD